LAGASLIVGSRGRATPRERGGLPLFGVGQIARVAFDRVDDRPALRLAANATESHQLLPDVARKPHAQLGPSARSCPYRHPEKTGRQLTPAEFIRALLDTLEESALDVTTRLRVRC